MIILKQTALRTLCALLALLFCTQTLAMPQIASQTPTYKFGVVPQFNAQRITTIWRPILDALEKQLKVQFNLTGASSIPAFEREFQSGEFDFVYINAYHFLRRHNAMRYMPVVRDTGRQLHGIIIVHKDYPNNKLRDLHGKKIAFPAANALGASMMIQADLRHAGISIKPVYVHSHSSVYLNVALRQLIAGGGVLSTFDAQPMHIRKALKIIHQTTGTSPHPIAVHPRINDSLKQSFVAALMNLAQTKQGAVMLANIPIKKIGVAKMADYESLIELGLEQYYAAE